MEIELEWGILVSHEDQEEEFDFILQEGEIQPSFFAQRIVFLELVLSSVWQQAPGQGIAGLCGFHGGNCPAFLLCDHPEYDSLGRR